MFYHSWKLYGEETIYATNKQKNMREFSAKTETSYDVL